MGFQHNPDRKKKGRKERKKEKQQHNPEPHESQKAIGLIDVLQQPCKDLCAHIRDSCKRATGVGFCAFRCTEKLSLCFADLDALVPRGMGGVVRAHPSSGGVGGGIPGGVPGVVGGIPGGVPGVVGGIPGGVPGVGGGIPGGVPGVGGGIPGGVPGGQGYGGLPADVPGVVHGAMEQESMAEILVPSAIFESVYHFS